MFIFFFDYYRYNNKVGTYDFDNPKRSTLSQVIWASTSTIGCGIAQSTDKKKFVLVVRYQAGGNVAGQYLENVKPLLSGEGSGTVSTTTTESPTQTNGLDEDDLEEGSFKSRSYYNYLFYTNFFYTLVLL